MATVNFKVVARDRASSTFRDVGNAALIMAGKVALANRIMDRAFWRGHNTFKTWFRIIILSLPLIPPAIVAVTHALGALNSALVSTIPGVGILSAALIGNFKDVKKAAGLKGLKEAFRDFLKGTRATSLKVFTSLFTLLSNLLPRLVPIANAFGKTLTKWLDHLDRVMQGKGFTTFLEWLRTVGATNFGFILSAFENLFGAIGNLAMAFSQPGMNLSKWLDDTMTRFRKWSGELGKSEGFRSFIDYFKTNWPALRDFFKELGTALIHILKAVAPLSIKFMEFVTPMLEAFNRIPVERLTTFLKILLGIKAVMMAIALIPVIASPFGVIIAASAVALAGLILLFNKSEKFRAALSWAAETLKTKWAEAMDVVVAAMDRLGVASSLWAGHFRNEWGRASEWWARVGAPRFNAAFGSVSKRAREDWGRLSSWWKSTGSPNIVSGWKAIERAVDSFYVNLFALAKRYTNVMHTLWRSTTDMAIGVIRAFVNVMRSWGNLFLALSKVPQFGWAKHAADAMFGAARKADDLANSIARLQSKSITVRTNFVTTHTVHTIRSGLVRQGQELQPRASGGRVRAGHRHLVGERGPEMFVPDVPGTIVPAHKTRSEQAAGGGIDYERLARALAKEIAKVMPSQIRIVGGDAGQRAYMLSGGA